MSLVALPILTTPSLSRESVVPWAESCDIPKGGSWLRRLQGHRDAGKVQFGGPHLNGNFAVLSAGHAPAGLPALFIPEMKGNWAPLRIGSRETPALAVAARSCFLPAATSGDCLVINHS